MVKYSLQECLGIFQKIYENGRSFVNTIRALRDEKKTTKTPNSEICWEYCCCRASVAEVPNISIQQLGQKDLYLLPYKIVLTQ